MEILSSNQASSELEKLEERRAELEKGIEEKREAFEKEDVEKRDVTLSEIECLVNQVSALDEEIAEMRNTIETLKEQETRMNILNHQPAEIKNDVTESEEYRDKWVAHVKGQISDAEMRAIATTDTGVPVPTEFQQYVETAWNKYGQILARVSKSHFAGLLAIPYEASATDAGYHTEGGSAPAEETVTLGQVLLQPAMIKKRISVTDEVRAMTGREFMRYIADELIYKICVFLEQQIVAGNGTNDKGVKGITNSAIATQITSEVSFNTINNALAELSDRAVDPVVIMNKKTFFNNFMGLTDTSGQPIFRQLTDNEGKIRYYLSGIEVLTTDALQDYDSTASEGVYAIVGDLSAYRLNYPEGEDVKVLHDIYTLATEDKERIIGRLLVAGDVVRTGSFVKVMKS